MAWLKVVRIEALRYIKEANPISGERHLHSSIAPALTVASLYFLYVWPPQWRDNEACAVKLLRPLIADVRLRFCKERCFAVPPQVVSPSHPRGSSMANR